MTAQAQIILKTEDLCKYYGAGDNLVKAVDHISLQIRQGEFVSIVGKSGSGKSTLLHMLGALDNPTAGKVWIDGENIASFKEEELSRIRRRKIGFVFQSYNLIPSLNVWENVVLPLGLDGKPLDEAFIRDILATLGLTEKVKNLPNTLSGGQQQRCAIARAIAAKPSIILADEPTGNLDTKMGDEVMMLLKASAKKYGQTLVVITHNEEIAQMAERTIILADGRILSDGIPSSVQSETEVR
ncbi:MAG: ABC transporter ATP-binding protein [Bacteroidales bacterium]|nr:ABC transporter ATP-binding protein [Bacteroidales bacterium]MCM1416136.1 ABC transporter ATP-binding protein [bacterium]MCM1423051.1 ABC transporter ATP-binding protein [bacterium]